MQNNTNQIHTSIFPDNNIRPVNPDQPKLSTGFIIVFLIVVMVLLKKFIYLKDEKREGI